MMGFLIPAVCYGAWDKTVPGDSDIRRLAPAQLRANWSAIEQGTDPALQVTDAKVAATANIQDAKLSTITTAGKVSGSAITGLSFVPSSAGALPLANGGTGQTTRTAAVNALLPDATAGDILCYDGTKWNRLASGTSGQFLQSQGSGVAPVYSNVQTIPSGGIIMWSGSIATIPAGWYLCDGRNGTPDLRGRFVIAAGGAYAAGTSGDGSIPLTSVSISFSLPLSASGGDGLFTDRIWPGGNGGGQGISGTYTGSGSGSFGTGTKVIATYYALAFVMKS